MSFDALRQRPHRRLNALTGEWVLVSPHRTQRPWQGQVETVTAESQPPYDPECYLCPGNGRVGGVHNPAYKDTFVFPNDFPALMPDVASGSYADAGLLFAESASGVCRVVCFSPRHDLTLAKMDTAAIRLVIDAWAEQFAELCATPGIEYVQIFENRGEMMGCSNVHPHGQIWATGWVPNEIAKETAAQADYRQRKGSCLLCDYWAAEDRIRERVVWENGTFAVVVPFWAVWPFETLVISKRHVGGLDELDCGGRDGLAAGLRALTRSYDSLFGISFPYSMGFHQKPCEHLHAHFYPPLLRSATVRKFMVGFEMLAMPQRDITPEAAAERLRLKMEDTIKLA
jgi:UDPglucose--hexose-1-phosphate uridylyltransferase